MENKLTLSVFTTCLFAGGFFACSSEPAQGADADTENPINGSDADSDSDADGDSDSDSDSDTDSDAEGDSDSDSDSDSDTDMNTGAEGDSDTDSDNDADSDSFQCTLVIGYSQVQQWFDAGFENIVDNGRWQLLWAGGAGVEQWSSASYSGWSGSVSSPCSSGSDAPDRVIYDISGGLGTDPGAWTGPINSVIGHIRDKYPSAVKIGLIPVVGGPGHDGCGGVRAAQQHPAIDEAIATLVGGDVEGGPSPELSNCSYYSDTMGHLTSQGSQEAAQQIGNFYR